MFDKEVITHNGIQTLLLYIDTSIYEIKSEENCYKNKYFTETIDKSKENTIDELINLQNTFIRDTIQNTECKNVLIFGHEPIITYKSKIDEQKRKDKSAIILNLAQKLFEIKAESPNKNFFYICADNHLHQKSTIKYQNNETYQYVFGTGGTDLDFAPTNANLKLKDEYNIEIDTNYHN